MTFQDGSQQVGSAFVCDRPVQGDFPNFFQAALITGNSRSSLSGPTDCVLNARDTLIRGFASGSRQPLRGVEDVVETLIPRGATAKIIGEGLVRDWRNLTAPQARHRLKGWHPVDILRYRRDFGAMWPNGIAFSGGTAMGHVSIHLQAGTRPMRLDQYATRAFRADPGLVGRAIAGTLGADEETSTEPALSQRVDRNLIFEWCNADWGCPSSEYLLD